MISESTSGGHQRDWWWVSPLVYFFASLLCSLTAQSARGTSATPVEMTSCERWISQHLGLGSVSPPFSFEYGVESSRSILPTWSSGTSGEAKNPANWIYTDPNTGLEVRCDITYYPGMPAVEWVLHITNTGTLDTQIIENVLPLDARISMLGKENPVLHYSDGSQAKETDFQPHEKHFDNNSAIQFAPSGGRSSDGVMPFFNLADESGGVIIGIGWTGQWKIAFKYHRDHRVVETTSGMERTRFLLHPGESVRSPSILLLFWSGSNWLRGQNLLRKLLLEHYTPMCNGQRAVPPIAASPHATIAFNDTTEANLLAALEATVSRKLPIDTWWLDAGWNAGGFPLGQGNWEPDPTRFPNGLKPISDAAHRHRLRFLMWYEPERVMRGSALFEQHPEWLLIPPANLPPKLEYHMKDGFYLLDLGNPEALAYAKAKTIASIRANGVDIFRQDFNMYPLYYWQTNEPAHRVGIREIRHIEGLYALWDALRTEFPNLIIDNCASGGRRLDFEMLRRSLVLWRSDLCWKPTPQQAMTHGLSLWLPLSGVGSISHDPYDIQSGIGSSLSFALDYAGGDPETWKRTTEFMERFKTIRPLFAADFYPLTPYSVEESAWAAWQYCNDGTGGGVVQAFRRSACNDSVRTFRLNGIDVNAKYVLTDLVDSKERTVLGHELAEGLNIEIVSMPGAKTLTYVKQLH
jgi:alpha-galactosidase